MTIEKLLKVIERYKDILQYHDAIQYQEDRFIDKGTDAYKHWRWMLDQMPQLIADGKIDKAMRWLGFIQGGFWALGIMPISTLKSDNRKDEHN